MAQEPGRRAEYAATPRQAILLAARELFIEQGYFDTRVEHIARAARVAVPTVYAAAGGKAGLLRTLIEDAVRAAEAGGSHERIAAQRNPDALLRMIVDGTRSEFQKSSPLIRQATAAAPMDAGVRESLGVALASLRRGLDAVANRLQELSALRPGMTAEEAANILWYFLGNASYLTLTSDCHWPLDRSADWLYGCLTSALMGDPTSWCVIAGEVLCLAGGMIRLWRSWSIGRCWRVGCSRGSLGVISRAWSRSWRCRGRPGSRGGVMLREVGPGSGLREPAPVTSWCSSTGWWPR